jgi:catechol 2,3-dioxygenase-like lactoylglutathione lyase family enzyme
MTRVVGTNHTSFTVSDLERTLGLFRDGLGFEVMSKAPRDPKLSAQITGVAGAELLIAFVRAPGHVIELIEYKAPAEKGRVVSRPCDAGFSHIAFNVDDVDGMLEAIKPYGVKPIGAPVAIDQGPNKGRRVVYTRDPDGITIELIEVRQA